MLAGELPAITDALTITGPGPRLLTITGGNNRRILSADAPFTISGIRLANGFTDRGGGIRFNSTSGPLNVSDCHFDQHLATGDGGAICVLAGSASIQRCTFTTDQAAGEGGGIWYGQGGGSPTMTITNCTFVNNFAGPKERRSVRMVAPSRSFRLMVTATALRTRKTTVRSLPTRIRRTAMMTASAMHARFSRRCLMPTTTA